MIELMYERISNSAAPWIHSLRQCIETGIPAVIVTSINRELGPHQDVCKLIVTESDCYGELDSRNPERVQEVQTRREKMAKATSFARELLLNSGTTDQHQRNDFLYELTSHGGFHVMLFGAGHVGQAVVSALQALSCRITWIDNREGIFLDSLPSNVTIVPCDEPDDEINGAPPGTHVLIMTHNHQLDLKICERALQQPNVSFCGLIGSSSKGNRFRKRLFARGLSDTAVNRLVCPIGIDGISGKEAGVIAISVTAQLLLIAEKEAPVSKDLQRTTLTCKSSHKTKNQL